MFEGILIGLTFALAYAWVGIGVYRLASFEDEVKKRGQAPPIVTIMMWPILLCVRAFF